MNTWLANGVAAFNGVIALLIIIIGALAGAIVDGMAGLLIAGGGFIVAILFCGPMAVILDIRDQLIKLNSQR
jgi:hypothetical protein